MSDAANNSTGGIGAPEVQKTIDAFSAERPTDGPLTEDDKTWGLIAHLAALSSFVGVPFGNIVGPLVVYLVKKDQSRFVHFHALQSLIFQIIVTVAAAVITIPILLLGFLSGGLLFIPIVALLGLISVAMLVYVIITGVKAKEGKWPLYVIAGNIAYEKSAQYTPKPAAEAAPPANPPA